MTVTVNVCVSEMIGFISVSLVDAVSSTVNVYCAVVRSRGLSDCTSNLRFAWFQVMKDGRSIKVPKNVRHFAL